MRIAFRLLLLLALAAGLFRAAEPPALLLSEEKHLANARQLTFAGENAEAYFSADDRWLSFQSHEGRGACDQIYVMATDGSGRRLVSTGKGKTTCAYFFPDGQRLLYSSSHLASPDCPPPPDSSRGYVWPILAGYDIFTVRPDGSDLRRGGR